MIRIQEIIDRVSEYTTPDLALIQKAYVFSASAHEGQTRRSGEPYLSHPLEVAYILAGMRMDNASIAAGLLHDTVEDTVATTEELVEKFGMDVAHIVDGVTKISQIVFDSKEDAQAESIRKMILAMNEDIRVILVKLADRLHNMSTLQFMKPESQRRIAQETLDIYAPLANRLGLHRVKVQLEDLCLKYLKPEVYNKIDKGVEEYATKEQGYIDKVIAMLQKMLRKNDIEGTVSGRFKHIYSIYAKMQQQGLELDEVYDLIAFRVQVHSLKDCFAVLGLVHGKWTPVPGRFKDYISLPKANKYQSLHTTVIGPDGERIEIQIRTEEMHQLAELGIAAHWQYKDTGKLKAEDAERYSWLRKILDWEKEAKDPRDFMTSLRYDLWDDVVYVFTPRGEVKELPEGSTPVDFAYLIHTEVGDTCSGSKVNGKLVPLSTRLRNGDMVSITTDPSRHPSRDWLKFVKTGKARTRINHWIRTEERARSIALGKEMLEKEGRKMGVNFQKKLQSGEVQELAEELSFLTEDDLMSMVGYSKLTPKKILNKLLPAKEQQSEPQEDETREQEHERHVPTEGVRIQGVDDVLVSFAQCCDPLPGDPIVGYITRGRGVTVHTRDCPNVVHFEPERLLTISWEGEKDKPYPAKIAVTCHNIIGALGKISALMAREEINIDSGSFVSGEDGISEIVFKVEVRDSTHLYETIDKIRKFDFVVSVDRMTIKEE